MGTIRLSGCNEQLQAVQRLREVLGQASSQLASDVFLNKCLVYQKFDIQAAAATVCGFLHFRISAGWPLRISAREVLPALRTGLHWLLWPASCASRSVVFPAVLSMAQEAPDSCPRSELEEDPGPTACLVFNMSRLDMRICSVEEYQKMSMFLMERATDEAATQQRGIAVVVDFRGVRFSQLTSSLTLADVRRGVLLWKGAFPCRLRRIWLLDTPRGMHYLVAGVLQLLSPKLRQRVCMATRNGGGLQRLASDLVPHVQLPACLGGSGEVLWDQAVSAYLAAEAPESSCMD